eukprot:3418377-Rhodomonas_salina.1
MEFHAPPTSLPPLPASLLPAVRLPPSSDPPRLEPPATQGSPPSPRTRRARASLCACARESPSRARETPSGGPRSRRAGA